VNNAFAAVSDRFAISPYGLPAGDGAWRINFPMTLKDLTLAARQSVRPRSGEPAAVSGADAQQLEALFLANLPAIDRAIQFVCHRHKVTAADAEEFASEVKLKLVDRNYQVFRKFEGRSSLPTFLTVVIQRLYLDFRNHQWGKWRPSAEARRLGPLAIRLETLMVRDGLGFSEACRHLKVNEQPDVLDSELAEIAGRLPPRVRRTIVGEDALENTTSETRADESALMVERRASAERIGRVLNTVVRQFSDQDRLILRLRFQEGFQVVDISRALHLPAKPLYRRLEGLLRQMRVALEAAGVDDAEARDVLSGNGLDISLALVVDCRPQ
jgi:RNA polymerase sigma factor (sigma-70 family)